MSGQAPPAGLLARLRAELGFELAEPVPDEHTRFNSGDFAPHNILVRPDDGLCAIDFDLDAHLAERAARLRQRLAGAERLVGALAGA